MKLYLIRGLPGSGKSTYAKHIIKSNPDTLHYEADMYFLDEQGNYNFDANKLKHAHAWCFDSTENGLSSGHDVIVSNTFTQKWEMDSYIKLAKKFNAELIILKATGNYKNIHGVPDVALHRMISRWEDISYEVEI